MGIGPELPAAHPRPIQFPGNRPIIMKSGEWDTPWKWGTGMFSHGNPTLVKGRTQSHSPGWVKVPFFSFASNFDQIVLFSLKLSPFQHFALRVDNSPIRKGNSYATSWCFSQFVFAGQFARPPSSIFSIQDPSFTPNYNVKIFSIEPQN